MGFNTTVVVLNDALDAISSDPKFGARLADAISRAQRGHPVDVSAHGTRYSHGNAATVIETHHADHTVYVGVGQNYGFVIGDEQREAIRKVDKRLANAAAKESKRKKLEDDHG